MVDPQIKMATLATPVVRAQSVEEAPLPRKLPAAPAAETSGTSFATMLPHDCWVSAPPAPGPVIGDPGMGYSSPCCPDPCGPVLGSCFYASGEYLMWWIRDSELPPLVTTSNPVESLGVIGLPGTAVLFGGGTVDNGERSGGRYTLGWWCDPCSLCGIEGSYLFLGDSSVTFAASSSGVPVLARPFFNINIGLEDAELIANPPIAAIPNLVPLAGQVRVDLSSQLWGAELNLRKNLLSGASCWGCTYRLDFLGGYRHLSLDEELSIQESLRVPANSPQFAGAGFLITDLFTTENHFNGGQIGSLLDFRWGPWSLDLRTKLALGATRQIAEINGATVFTQPGQSPRLSTGGLLALPTNIGHYTRDVFSVVPELGLNVGYQCTPCLRLFVGYTFIYWSNVARPGEQIDREINPSQLPRFNGSGGLAGAARPAFTFKDNDFWVQGINFGLEYRY